MVKDVLHWKTVGPPGIPYRTTEGAQVVYEVIKLAQAIYLEI